MGHDHSHSHRTVDNIRVAFLLNLGFTVLEIVGGFLTNSVAILSDAVHDLGDSFSLGIAWYLENYSEKGANERYSYGYRRFSLIGAVVTSVVLITGSIFILSEALERLMNPEAANGPGMVVIALFGVAVNGAAVLRLRHDESMNAQAVAWHLLEDVLGWVAVLVVGITLIFVDMPILDPALSILLTLYVLYNIISNVRKTLRIFLQATPENINLPDLERQLATIDGVLSQHHTHVWSLDGEHHVLSAHLVIGEHATKDDMCRVKSAAKSLVDTLHFEHVTIEIEYEDEECGMRQPSHHE